jgi:hypothetical protein
MFPGAQGRLSPGHGRDCTGSEGPFGLSNSKASMEEATTGAPVIPFEILRNQLEQYCFGDRSLRIEQRSQKFLWLQFRSQQVSYVHESARLEFGLKISIVSLDEAFNCSPAAVERSLRNSLNRRNRAAVILHSRTTRRPISSPGSSIRPRNPSPRRGRISSTPLFVNSASPSLVDAGFSPDPTRWRFD